MATTQRFVDVEVEYFLEAAEQLSTTQWREVRRRHASVRKADWSSILNAVKGAGEAKAQAVAPAKPDRRQWEKAHDHDRARVAAIVKRLPPELSVGDVDFPIKIYQAIGLYVAVLRVRDPEREDRITKRACDTIEGLFNGLIAPQQREAGRGPTTSAVADTRGRADAIRPALRTPQGDYAPGLSICGVVVPW